MKHYIIASLIMSSQIAMAQPFDFQKAVGSSELDPAIWDGPGEVVKRGAPSDFKPSIVAVYELTNLDGRQPFAHVGDIKPSGPTRISLYEAYREIGAGDPYADYYAQFPDDSNEDAVAEKSEQRDGDV